jgi:hypothetical protein
LNLICIFNFDGSQEKFGRTMHLGLILHIMSR